MNESTGLVRIDAGPAGPPGGGDGSSPDAYRLAIRSLRGRWGVVIAMGILWAAAGAAVGWKLGKPQYRSEGIVRIAYSRPVLVKPETEGAAVPIEVYQAFLGTQQALLSSRRVIDLAMEDKAWTDANAPAAVKTASYLASGLNVDRKPTTDYISVTFTDPDPQLAAAAVRAIINGYEQIYNSQESTLDQKRLAYLEDRQKQLRQQLDQLGARQKAISGDVAYGTADRLYDSAAAQLLRIETMLTDIRLARQLAGEHGTALGPEQIAIVDPTMRAYLTERDRIDSQIATLKVQGVGERNMQLAALQTQRLLAEDRINRYAEQYRQVMASMPPMMGVAAAGGGAMANPALSLAPRSAAELAADEQKVGALYKQARQDIDQLAAKKMAAENLKTETTRVSAEMMDVNRRIDQLRAESGIGGRMTILSRGDVPLLPVKDLRLKLAGLGAAGGAVFPAALLAILGLVRGGYRYSTETEDDLAGRVPLLGILPALPDRLSDASRAMDAAQAVHQIRVMLQMNGAQGRCPVYLLTSASPGEGKTSLAAALGLAYAGSGARTLLMDADFIGQWLSHGFEVERSPGLREAIKEGSINGHARATPTPNLFCLPAGQVDPRDANVISQAALGPILQEARRDFDVVLIDSGPVLGSVEAAVLAGQVDGVLLVIARHQQRPLVQRAVRQLRSVGARISGMVFNRAYMEDLRSSMSCSSLRSASSSQRIETAIVRVEHTRRFGPLVRCVASMMPGEDERRG